MRIIDLSKPLIPGQNCECTVPDNLPVYMGLACEEYRYAFRSHVGCYFETAAHLYRGGTMTGDVPIEQLIGPAVVARLDPAKSGAIEPDEIRPKLQPGDVLLVDAGKNTNRFFSRAFGRWLAENKVRLLGATLPLYDTGFTNPTGVFIELFQADIPIIAELQNVDQITHERIVLIVLPLAVENVCTVPARVVALDGEENEIQSLLDLLHVQPEN